MLAEGYQQVGTSGLGLGGVKFNSHAAFVSLELTAFNIAVL